MTSCLTAIKNHVIKNCTTVYERNGKNLFWSIKNIGEILNKLKSRGILASGLCTYDFYSHYTTLPHNLIKEKLTELIEQTFNREGSLYLACNNKNAFFTSEQPKRYKLWLCQKMCDALHYLLDNIFIRFCSKLYRQIVGIPIVLLLLQVCFCFVMRETLCCLCQTIIKLILLKLFTQIPLKFANSSDTENPFLDLNLSITNGIVSSKIYDKRDNFNFEIVNFPFLDGDVPHSPSFGVYICQLIRFAKVCSNVDDFNNRNLFFSFLSY